MVALPALANVNGQLLKTAPNRMIFFCERWRTVIIKSMGYGLISLGYEYMGCVCCAVVCCVSCFRLTVIRIGIGELNSNP
jgi:hypothetical protein